MEDGKRLENLSWRLFSRESFCCAPDQAPSPRMSFGHKRTDSSPQRIPELSSSFDSVSSDEGLQLSTTSCPTSARPELRRNDSANSHSRKQQHISSIDLEKIVASIKTNQDLVPLSPLPSTLTLAQPVTHTAHEIEAPKETREQEIAPEQREPSSPKPTFTSNIHFIPESSTSTLLTGSRSDISDMSPPLASSDTTSTELSATSIVRGFSRDHISSSMRSRTQLAPTPVPSTSILKTSPLNRSGPAPAKKKGATFQLGGSSGEGDESSLESRYMSGMHSFGKSSLGDALRSRSSSRKVTSFNEEVATRTIESGSYANVFDEDSEEEDEGDHSESAIEDENDVWEDEEDEDVPSSPASVNEKDMFQRVEESKPNLVSRRSLLTSLMHEKDRAAALQNAASRSTPAIRRSRTTSPNGPLGSSPKNAPQPLPQSQTQGLAQASRARPIIMTTSNVHPPALSPRTTRRNMLSTELTESLRKHLLWDRQVNRSTTNAALKRRHTAQDMTKLKNFPGESQPAPFIAPMKEPQNTNSWNNYFDSGLQEYHQKGW
jgi:hypothetical protein